MLFKFLNLEIIYPDSLTFSQLHKSKLLLNSLIHLSQVYRLGRAQTGGKYAFSSPSLTPDHKPLNCVV